MSMSAETFGRPRKTPRRGRQMAVVVMEKQSASVDLVDSAKRRQIIEGARQVFLAEGFDGASMGEIAKAAGVSKGTLYVYFSSKEALFAALTIEKKKDLAEVLFQIDVGDPDVRAVLAR